MARAEGKDMPPDQRLIKARFFNLRHLTEMKQIKATHVDLFVALRGNVVCNFIYFLTTFDLNFQSTFKR